MLFSVVPPVARGLMLGSVAWTCRGKAVSEPRKSSLCSLIQCLPLSAPLCQCTAAPQEVLHKFPSTECREICRGFIFALPAPAPSVFPIGELQLYGCLQRIPWQSSTSQGNTLGMQESSHFLKLLVFFISWYWVQKDTQKEKNCFCLSQEVAKNNFCLVLVFWVFFASKYFNTFYFSYFPSAWKAF